MTESCAFLQPDMDPESDDWVGPYEAYRDRIRFFFSLFSSIRIRRKIINTNISAVGIADYANLPYVILNAKFKYFISQLDPIGGRFPPTRRWSRDCFRARSSRRDCGFALPPARKKKLIPLSNAPSFRPVKPELVAPAKYPPRWVSTGAKVSS